MNFSLNRITRALVPAVGLTFALGAAAQQQGADTAQPQSQQGQATSMALSKEIVTRIQQTLKDRGSYDGQIDGIWGEKTQSAVRQFQQSQNLQATGKVNAQTLAAMGIETGEMAQREQPSTTAAAQQAQTTAAATAQRDRDPQAQAGMGGTMRLSQLVGKEVRNAQGEDLGEISDVVIDVNNERVHYAILSFGGMLGMGEKKFAYPMRTLSVSPTAEQVVLNVPKERLERAPGFEEASEPSWGMDDPYRRDVDQYFGDMVKVEAQPNTLLRRASTLMDADVNDARGEDIGDIEDVIVNTADGSVKFAVVAFDPGWTEPERYTTVPLRAFQFTGENDEVALRLNQQQIGTAPGFQRDRWNEMGPDYSARVDRWFTDMDADIGTATRDPIDPVTDPDRRQ